MMLESLLELAQAQGGKLKHRHKFRLDLSFPRKPLAR